MSALVPPILHQAWIGRQPDWVGRRRELVAELCREAGVVHMFWDDQAIAEVPMLQNIIKLHTRYELDDVRVVKDIMRMWLLRTYGGIWMDNDIHPLRPLGEFVNRPGWVCVHFGEGAEPNVCQQALFAAPADAPFLGYIIEHSLKQLRAGVKNPHFIAGPRAFRAAMNEFPGSLEHWERMQMKVPQSLRNQARAGEIDVPALREQYPEALFIHIGMESVHLSKEIA